jgi:hypothetical protein
MDAPETKRIQELAELNLSVNYQLGVAWSTARMFEMLLITERNAMGKFKEMMTEFDINKKFLNPDPEQIKKEIELDYIWHNTKCSEILNRVSKGTATHDDAVFLADSLGINCFKQEK